MFLFSLSVTLGQSQAIHPATEVTGVLVCCIKTNLENDCLQLRESIPDKLLFIDEQMMQLTLAKRLLKKIRAKGDASPMEAIRLSLEEEHLEWHETNLSTDQYRLIEELMAKPEGHELHDEMIRLIKSTKPLIQSDKKSDVIGVLDDIKAMFYVYRLDEDTVRYLLDAFIKSSLEGPLAQRILTVKESVYVLNLLNP
jgi:hypothetical protein